MEEERERMWRMMDRDELEETREGGGEKNVNSSSFS